MLLGGECLLKLGVALEKLKGQLDLPTDAVDFQRRAGRQLLLARIGQDQRPITAPQAPLPKRPALCTRRLTDFSPAFGGDLPRDRRDNQTRDDLLFGAEDDFDLIQLPTAAAQ